MHGDSFKLDNTNAWYYCLMGHKVGTVCQVKVKKDGVKMFYSAVLVRVISNPELSQSEENEGEQAQGWSDESEDGPLSSEENENEKIVEQFLASA